MFNHTIVNDVNRSPRSRSLPGALPALFLLGCGVASLPALAGNNYFNGPADFQYCVSGLPDFDQMRDGLNQAPNHPWPGMMYCGPTAGTNMIAFMNSHGYPAVLPLDAPDTNWQDPANHGKATLRIADMAVLMPCKCKDDPTKGTWPHGFANGIRQAVKNAGAPINVTYYQAKGAYAPTLNQIAQIGLNGSIMSLLWADYIVVGFTPTGYRIVVPAYSGHCVTVSRVKRKGNLCQIWFRDPADENPGAFNPPFAVDIDKESGFKDNKMWADDGWVFVVGQGWRWTTRLNTTNFPPYPGIGGKFRLIEAVITARPQRAVGRNANGNLVIVNPGGWQAGPGGAGAGCVELPLAFGVVAMAQAPDPGQAVVVAAAQGVAGEGTGNLMLVDASTGGATTIGSVPGAGAVTMGRSRTAYVVANGSEVVAVPIPTLNEEDVPEEAPPPEFTTLKLPHAADALVYDDDADELVLISAADGRLMRVNSELTGPVDVQELPAGVVLDASVRLSIDPEDGSIWLISGASETIYGLKESKGDAAGFDVEEVNVPGLESPTSLDVRSGGSLLVATETGIIELVREENQWVISPDSDFGVLECVVEDLIVDRDRSNFNPILHDPPDWLILPPTEIEPGIAVPDPVCAGDINGDGQVDAADLGLLISGWGPNFGDAADFNDDDVVDGTDLGILLSLWGPCPRF